MKIRGTGWQLSVFYDSGSRRRIDHKYEYMRGKGLLTYPVETKLPWNLKLWSMPRLSRQSPDLQFLCLAAHGLKNFLIWVKFGPTLSASSNPLLLKSKT
jgi:hypothetical protein